MHCPHCSAENENTAQYCAQCGTLLQPSASQPTPQPTSQSTPQSSTQPSLLSPEQTITGTQGNPADDMQALYALCIGPNQQDYYLERFARFEAQGKAGISWHWPAFFITFFWMLYRKMWLPAVLYFFLPTVIFTAVGLLGLLTESAEVIVITAVIGMVCIFFAPPLWANALYYRHCKNLIRIAQKPPVNPAFKQPPPHEALSTQGGTNLLVPLVIALPGFLSLLALVGILSAIALPAYVTYQTRAQVLSAYHVGKNATQAVSNYINTHDDVPETLQAAGFNETLPPFIDTIELDPEAVVISLTFADGKIAGRTLQFELLLDEAQQSVFWGCQAPDIEDTLLPKPCRSALPETDRPH